MRTVALPVLALLLLSLALSLEFVTDEKGTEGHRRGPSESMVTLGCHFRTSFGRSVCKPSASAQ